MRGRWSLAVLGVVLILAGGLLAHFTQTAGGIRIEDVRFKGAKGNTMSALLYIPANATPQIPAPGILAVHGYINSRETQDGFAIEFARRGYVVLALDQTGHGYSDPPAFANGFGGPDGLAYLRSLEFVDKNNIGLEGHSKGRLDRAGGGDRCAQRLQIEWVLILIQPPIQKTPAKSMLIVMRTRTAGLKAILGGALGCIAAQRPPLRYRWPVSLAFAD
jgi:hypothetical protein